MWEKIPSTCTNYHLSRNNLGKTTQLGLEKLQRYNQEKRSGTDLRDTIVTGGCVPLRSYTFAHFLQITGEEMECSPSWMHACSKIPLTYSYELVVILTMISKKENKL